MKLVLTKRLMPVLIVAAVAMAVRLAALKVVPVETKPWGDSAQYINLAGSIADGTGYQLEEGNFWPGKPTLVRAPGWPVLLSIPFKVVPRDWRWVTARLLAVAFDVLNAIIIMMLARALGGSLFTATVAGGLYGLNPVTAALSAQAGSEPFGVTLLLLFLVSALRGRTEGYSRYLAPGLMLGMACLVRANWLVIAGCFGIAFCWVHRGTWRRAFMQIAVFGIAVVIPLMPWVVRNYQVFHHFPILGAGGGETFYGGNNELAADRHSQMWGYIVQPGGIPGAVPLSVLAAKMNEYEVDRYWMKEGWVWLKANPGKIPGLVAGKLRRAFVPIPYNSRSPVVWAASMYRAFLYAAAMGALFLMVRKRITLPIEVWILLGAVVVANVLTAVMFCGVMRYVIGFEVLLCVSAGWFVSRLWSGCSRKQFKHG